MTDAAAHQPVPARRLGGLMIATAALYVWMIGNADGQTTRRLSVRSNEVEGTGSSQFADCDFTGRRAVFASQSKDLVNNDGNFAWDIFLRDQGTGKTRRLSVDSSENEANSDSFDPAISDDAMIVAFESNASNLVAGDTNGVMDVFVRDRSNGTTIRVSTDSSGAQANGSSRNAAVSADGRFVAFESSATNLVAGDTNGASDVFVKNLSTGQTLRASVGFRFNQGNAGSFQPKLNADGTVVVFASDATNLLSSDSNGHRDVFYRNLASGVFDRVSEVGTTGGDDDSSAPDVDASGRRIVFESRANDLSPSDLNAGSDIFLYDLDTNELQLISVTSDGKSVHGAAVHPSISFDGNEIAFTSYSSLLVGGDGNSERDIFLHDRAAATTERVSLSYVDTEANDWSDFAQVSGDGRQVVWHSPATNLVPFDTNDNEDVFVRGPWLLLDLDPPLLYEFDPFDILCAAGKPDSFLLLQIVEVNGSPFRLNLGVFPFDGEGRFRLGGTTPPGLSGMRVGLQMLGFGVDEELHVSDVANLLFR